MEEKLNDLGLGTFLGVDIINTVGVMPESLDNPELVVVSPTGEYDDSDIIQCAYVGEETPVCGFEARYIELGNSIYR